MRFLIDESTGRKLAGIIKQAGYNAVFSFDILGRTSDEELLKFAEKKKYVLISDDKDFGELIFRLNKPASGVIFLRMAKHPKKRFAAIKGILDKAEGKFIVVKEGQIKIRDLKRL